MLFLRLLIPIAAAAVTLSGCVQNQAAPRAESTQAPASLLGKEWFFVGFQSSSDDQPKIEVPLAKANYSVTFEPSGRASMQLDCNRGHGEWTSSDLTQPMGSLRFGPVASTMMGCLNAHSKEGFTPDFEHIGGYRLEGGDLYLSLIADGGIYHLKTR